MNSTGASRIDKIVENELPEPEKIRIEPMSVYDHKKDTLSFAGDNQSKKGKEADKKLRRTIDEISQALRIETEEADAF